MTIPLRVRCVERSGDDSFMFGDVSPSLLRHFIPNTAQFCDFLICTISSFILCCNYLQLSDNYPGLTPEVSLLCKFQQTKKEVNMTGTIVYGIWATNGKEEKEKLFFNQKKAHDAAVACKKKGLKFFAGTFYTNYCGYGKTKFGIGIDNKMSVEETEIVVEQLRKKVEWFSQKLEERRFSAFGTND
jgi:hypothetical protein